jgi:hypothetical protein
MRLLLPRSAVLLLTTACYVERPPECTDEARPSVMVVAVDDEDERVSDVAGTFRVDDGPLEVCESLGDGLLLCGWESVGSFSLRIEAPGYRTEELWTEVDVGRCHVSTVDLDVELTAEENG